MAFKVFFNMVKKLCCFISMYFLFVIPAISLPAGYTELEYIEGTGTQWIDTGYILQSDNIIYQWTAKDTQTSGNTSLFGSEIGTIPKYAGILHGNQANRSLWMGQTAGTSVGYKSADNEFHSWTLDIKDSGNVSLSKDGTEVGNIKWITPIQKSKSVAVFANNGRAQITKAMFKAFTIIDNDQIKVNLVPAKQDASNKIGMYDTVSKTFLENRGSGTFVAGPVVSIHIATTKYIETQFAPLITALNTAISSVSSVVSTTITQADQIKKIAETKQNRPDDYKSEEMCPEGRKCLLIQDVNGIPHWMEIYDPANDFIEALVKAGMPGASDGFFKGNVSWQQKYGDGTSNVSVQQTPFNLGMFHTLTDSEWAVIYGENKINNTGVIYGTSKCVSKNLTGQSSFGTPATAAQLADPLFNATPKDSTDAQDNILCWCKATDIGVLGTDGQTESGNLYPLNETSWVFGYQFDSISGCVYKCAQLCTDAIQDDDFRHTVYNEFRNTDSIVNDLLAMLFANNNPSPKAVSIYKSNDGNEATPMSDYHPLGGKYREVQNGEWAIVYVSDDVVYGEAKCNNIPLETGQIAEDKHILDPGFAMDGGACWCGMTNIGTDISIYPVSETIWTSYKHYDSSEECAAKCSYQCAEILVQDFYFRWSVLGLDKYK